MLAQSVKRLTADPGAELDPGPVPYIRGDKLLVNCSNLRPLGLESSTLPLRLTVWA